MPAGSAGRPHPSCTASTSTWSARCPSPSASRLLARVGAQHASARDSFHGSGAVIVLDAQRVEVGDQLQVRRRTAICFHAQPDAARRSRALPHQRRGGQPRRRQHVLAWAWCSHSDATAAPAPHPVAAPVYEAPPPPPPPVAVIAAPQPPPPAPTHRPRRAASASQPTRCSRSIAPNSAQGQGGADQFAHELAGMQFDRHHGRGPHRPPGFAGVQPEAVAAPCRSRQGLSRLDPAASQRGRITAIGKGESQPVTKAERLPWQRSRTPKLIACLQPDRRVDVEVSGTSAQ